MTGLSQPVAPAGTSVRERILVVGLNFAPEETGVGKYTGEMVRALAAKGYPMSVITTEPYYPDLAKDSSRRGFAWREETWEGCRVVRCPLYVPARWTFARRFLHLSSFALSSLPVIFARAIRERPQVIAVVVPTILSAPIVWLAAKLCAAKTWIHVQDFEIDVALNLGFVGRRWSAAAARFVERWILRRFDLVSTISSQMADVARRKGVRDDRLFLLPNWIDTAAIYPLARPSPRREALGIPGGRCVVLYSGSMGAKQGWQTVAEAARLLAGDTCENVLFVFAGSGSGRAVLEKAAGGLPNVMLLPLQPAATFNEFLGVADVHLMPQLEGVSELVMPSKLGAMLASGRPIVATVDKGSPVAEAIGEAGLLVAPGDAQGLADAIGLFARDAPRRRAASEAARRAALALPTPEALFSELAERLRQLSAR